MDLRVPTLYSTFFFPVQGRQQSIMGWGHLSLHIMSAGIWGGCIATEVLLEKFLAGHGKEVNKLLAKVHYYADLVIEMPASIICYTTGLKLLIGRAPSKFVHSMAGLGAAALAFNIACFYNVHKRYQASLTNNWDEFEKHDKLQYRVGKGAVYSFLLAFGLSLYMSTNDYN